MGAKKLKTIEFKDIDFNKDPGARRDLLDIIESDARYLYPSEVAWFLASSITQVYEHVPRAKTIDGSVRFSTQVVKSIKSGVSAEQPKTKEPKVKTKAPRRPKPKSKGKEIFGICL